MSTIGRLLMRVGRRLGGEAPTVPGEQEVRTSERGHRTTPENYTKYLYRFMGVDSAYRAMVLDIRKMDREDSRVKRIHSRTAREAIKGGLRLSISAGAGNERVVRAWDAFVARLKLNRPEKLESDLRGLMMEGNLPIQWVLGADNRVAAAVRMPTDTLLPVVLPNGTFNDAQQAYEQYDLTSGAKVATFALWQLTMGRLTPDNYDDNGSLGRPYLDATRTVWLKLTMTEEDLVIRRRERAPLRTAHFLEGASEEELKAYRERIEDDQTQITSNYYSNKKGAVQAVQGDANLDQIADVAHLMDTFFAGAPAPKGLFGYTKDLARDILEDMKRDYFQELDAMQEQAAAVYRVGFELDLLLQGINPMDFDFRVEFAERRTETANQAADRALKWQAIGMSRQTVIEAAGGNYKLEKSRRDEEAKEVDPYPEEDGINPPAGAPRVSVTPGNQRKAESGTTISN